MEKEGTESFIADIKAKNYFNTTLFKIITRAIAYSIYYPIFHLQDDDESCGELWVFKRFYEASTEQGDIVYKYKNNNKQVHNLKELKEVLTEKIEVIDTILKKLTPYLKMESKKFEKLVTNVRKELTEIEKESNRESWEEYTKDREHLRLVDEERYYTTDFSIPRIEGEIIKRGKHIFIQGTTKEQCAITCFDDLKEVIERLTKLKNDSLTQLTSVNFFSHLEEDGLIKEAYSFLSTLQDFCNDIDFEITENEFIEYLTSISLEFSTKIQGYLPANSPFCKRIIYYDIMKWRNNHFDTTTLNYFDVFLRSLIEEIDKSIIAKRKIFNEFKNIFNISIFIPKVNTRLNYEYKVKEVEAQYQISDNIRVLADSVIQAQIEANKGRVQASKIIAEKLELLADSTLGITTEEQEEKQIAMAERNKERALREKYEKELREEYYSAFCYHLSQMGIESERSQTPSEVINGVTAQRNPNYDPKWFYEMKPISYEQWKNRKPFDY